MVILVSQGITLVLRRSKLQEAHELRVALRWCLLFLFLFFHCQSEVSWLARLEGHAVLGGALHDVERWLLAKSAIFADSIVSESIGLNSSASALHNDFVPSFFFSSFALQFMPLVFRPIAGVLPEFLRDSGWPTWSLSFMWRF